MAYLSDQVAQLDPLSVLIDTAHVPMERQALAVNDTAVDAVLAQADDELCEQLSEGFQQSLQDNVNLIKG